MDDDHEFCLGSTGDSNFTENETFRIEFSQFTYNEKTNVVLICQMPIEEYFGDYRTLGQLFGNI